MTKKNKPITTKFKAHLFRHHDSRGGDVIMAGGTADEALDRYIQEVYEWDRNDPDYETIKSGIKEDYDGEVTVMVQGPAPATDIELLIEYGGQYTALYSPDNKQLIIVPGTMGTDLMNKYLAQGWEPMGEDAFGLIYKGAK